MNPFHCIVIEVSWRESERKIKVNDNVILYVYKKKSKWCKYSFGSWYSLHSDSTSKEDSYFVCINIERRVSASVYILCSHFNLCIAFYIWFVNGPSWISIHSYLEYVFDWKATQYVEIPIGKYIGTYLFIQTLDRKIEIFRNPNFEASFLWKLS